MKFILLKKVKMPTIVVGILTFISGMRVIKTSGSFKARTFVVFPRVLVCVHACVRACVRTCVRACVCVCVLF